MRATDLDDDQIKFIIKNRLTTLLNALEPLSSTTDTFVIKEMEDMYESNLDEAKKFIGILVKRKKKNAR